MILTRSGGTVRVQGRPFKVQVHSRELVPGVQPQDAMQVLAVSFEPTEKPGIFPVIVLAFWLRESRTVIVQYSLEEQVEYRGRGGLETGYTFSMPDIVHIENRLPEFVAQALSTAGIDMAGFTIVSRRQSIGIGMNDGPTIGGVPYQDWAIRRALGIVTRPGGRAGDAPATV
ncbi:MAG: hypothetical protein ACRYFS_25765 [Janthinobacterium lividum]